jgi:sulfofructose kinase
LAGLSCIDHLWRIERFPPTSSRTRTSAYSVQGGGPAATAAVAAARLGARTELWALHGDDSNGRFAREELRSYGVGVEGVLLLEEAVTFVSAVLTDPDGERYIFPYRGLGLEDDPRFWDLDRVADFDALLIDARFPTANRALLERAADAGVPSVGDFGNTDHFELAERVDYVLVSEECAVQVLGRNDPEAALDALRWRPEQVVGITLGPEGFLFHNGDEMRHISALPVEVVDSTGAGDVFHGAFAYGVAVGWKPSQCGLFASVVAALSCTAIGRSGIPSADDVRRLLELRSVKEMSEMEWT